MINTTQETLSVSFFVQKIWLTQKLTSQCAENKCLEFSAKNETDTCILPSLQGSGATVDKVRKDISKTVSSGHDKTATFTNSQQLCWSVQDQTSEHSSMEWEGT